MSPKGKGFKFYGGLFVVAMGTITLYCASIAQGPDRDLNFVRDVPSESSPEILDQAIQGVANWPNWFFSTADVKVVDVLGRPLPTALQEIKKGAHVKIYIDPKKGKWKKFEVDVAITEYEPKKRICFHVLSDSKGKLNELFDRLDWEIDLVPQAGGTIVRGIATAHTRNWRSRFFGTIAERILMHQVYYPDLNRLAQIKQPLPLHPRMEM